MVSKKKMQTLKEVEKQIGEYSVVGILNMHKLPARQLHHIRNKLRGQAVIRMVKKRILTRALDKHKLKLGSHIQDEPALFLTNDNPFRMAKILQSSTSEASAKPGDIAPRDLIIPEGPTNLAPGPIIGELQKVKIPAGVEGDKIVVKRETVIAKEGDVISADVAGVLSKMEIQPMEIGLNLVAVSEKGVVYDRDVLFVPEDFYSNQINEAVQHALNLAVHINHFTPETIPLLLGRAHREAETLALEAGIATPATIGGLLAKAHAEAEALKA